MNQTNPIQNKAQNIAFQTVGILAIFVFAFLFLTLPFTAQADVIPPAPAPTGTLTVCKMIVDQNGNIATSSAGLAQGYFGLTLGTTTDIFDTTLLQDQWSAESFTPNTSLVLQGQEDAQCYTHTLPLGQYYYSQEDIAGNFPVWTQFPVRYYAGLQSGFSIASSSTYSTTPLPNDFSDGVVTLDANTPNKIVVLVNGYQNNNSIPTPPTPPTNPNPPTVCTANANLIVNGSFETPAVTNQFGWNVFSSTTPGIGWNAEWLSPITSFGGETRPAPSIEIGQGQVYGVTALDGSQVAELDGDWNGPVNQIANTPASTGIYQTIATIPGDTYTLSYGFAPRAGQSAAENVLGVYENDTTLATLTASGTGMTQTTFTTYTDTFVATSAETRIEFKDLGVADSYGTLVDKVSLDCVPNPVTTPTNQPPVITVLGTNPITITQGTTYVDPGATAQDPQDGNITSKIITTGSVATSTVGTYTITYTVTDNEGLSDTKTRTVDVVAPNTYCPNGGDMTYTEYLQAQSAGLIHITLATSTQSSTATADITNTSGCTFPVSLASYQVFDQVLSHQVFFSGSGLVDATSTTDLQINLPSCMAQIDLYFGSSPKTLIDGDPYTDPSGPVVLDSTFIYNATDSFANASGQFCTETTAQPPVITVLGPNPFTLTQGTTYVDPGATAQDPQDGNITSKIITTGSVATSTVGTYTITYTVTDNEGLSDTKTRTVDVVAPNNGGGGTNTGTVDVCLVIERFNGGIATSSANLVPGTFALNIASTSDIASSTIEMPSWNVAGFTPNRMLISTTNDANCISYTNIPFGTYYYSQATTTGIAWGNEEYNDGALTPVDSLSDFFPFSTTTPDADGMIALNSMNTTQTLAVLEIATNTPPTITLLGANPFALTQGTAFVDPGATAFDVEDGDLTSKIVPSGTVDDTTVGTYTIIYSVTDSGGLTASTTREVDVTTANNGGGGGTTPPQTCTATAITSSLSITGIIGNAFNYQETATATSTITFGDIASSTLPDGLTFASTTGIISGVPTTAGTYPITLVATSDCGTTTSTATITISPASVPTGGGGGGGGGGNGPIVGSLPPATNGGGGGGPVVSNPVTTTTSSGAGSCYYLYDYLHTGWNNDPVEVKKLQVFLKDLEGYNVNVTGIYDAQTVSAVDAFQVKYADDILVPWDGTDNPSGFTYILTKKKVNEIYCQEAFPLSPEQQQTITAYRQFIEDLNANGVQIVPPTPAQLNPAPVTTGEIGQATSSSSSNLAIGGPVGSTTSIISSSIGNAAAAILAFPWNWIKGIVSPNKCVLGNAAWCKWIDVVIAIIILILIYLLFRGPRQPQDVEDINKELDLN